MELINPIFFFVFITFTKSTFGLQCFSCVLKTQENAAVTRKCEDFYKASLLEQQQQFVIECKPQENACIHHKNTGGSSVYLEEYGCHTVSAGDHAQGLLMDECVEINKEGIQGVWKTCLCNKDFCRVDESHSYKLIPANALVPLVFIFSFIIK